MIPLTETERRWAQVAFVTLFPSGVHPRVRGADVIDGGAALDGLAREVPARVALGLRAAVWLFAFAPVWTLGRLLTLADLDVPSRERVALRLLSSRVYVVRQLALLLKAFAALLFLRGDDVRDGILGTSHAS